LFASRAVILNLSVLQRFTTNDREDVMSLILLVVLVVLLLGALPAWPYSRGWGYYPSGGLGLVVVVLLVLLLAGRL
jgi:hypothetical protein